MGYFSEKDIENMEGGPIDIYEELDGLEQIIVLPVATNLSTPILFNKLKRKIYSLYDECDFKEKDVIKNGSYSYSILLENGRIDVLSISEYKKIVNHSCESIDISQLSHADQKYYRKYFDCSKKLEDFFNFYRVFSVKFNLD